MHLVYESKLCNNPLAEPQDPKAPDGRSAARVPVVVPGLGGRGDGPSLGVRRAALAHVVQNKVEAACKRTDLFERRRRLMDDWSAYLAGGR